jgi:hypothetical protein
MLTFQKLAPFKLENMKNDWFEIALKNQNENNYSQALFAIENMSKRTQIIKEENFYKQSCTETYVTTSKHF